MYWVFLLFLTLTTTPVILSAQEFVPLIGIPGLNPESGLEQYVTWLYYTAIAAAAFLAVVRLIIAGIQYMFTDVVNNKQQAKANITGALLGLLIIIGAVTILNTINPQLTQLSFLEGSAVNFSGFQVNRDRSIVSTGDSIDFTETSTAELARFRADCLAQGNIPRTTVVGGTARDVVCEEPGLSEEEEEAFGSQAVAGVGGDNPIVEDYVEYEGPPNRNPLVNELRSRCRSPKVFKRELIVDGIKRAVCINPDGGSTSGTSNSGSNTSEPSSLDESASDSNLPNDNSESSDEDTSSDSVETNEEPGFACRNFGLFCSETEDESDGESSETENSAGVDTDATNSNAQSNADTEESQTNTTGGTAEQEDENKDDSEDCAWYNPFC